MYRGIRPFKFIYGNSKPIDRIRAISRHTDKHLRRTDGRTDATKYIISLASRSIKTSIQVHTTEQSSSKWKKMKCISSNNEGTTALGRKRGFLTRLFSCMNLNWSFFHRWTWRFVFPCTWGVLGICHPWDIMQAAWQLRPITHSWHFVTVTLHGNKINRISICIISTKF